MYWIASQARAANEAVDIPYVVTRPLFLLGARYHRRLDCLGLPTLGFSRRTIDLALAESMQAVIRDSQVLQMRRDVGTPSRTPVFAEPRSQ